MKVILASKSPRRDEILTIAGIDHDILVSEADETLPEGMSTEEAVCELSRRKALAVLSSIGESGAVVTGSDTSAECAVVIGADTMVECDGEIFGKPKDKADAERMLGILSDNIHYVHTGVTVATAERRVTECVTTKVKMRKIEEAEIEGYIESGEPFDKAGAYGIQGIGGIFVSSLEGDYFNVMGLPMCRLCEILKKFGVNSFNK